MPEDVVLGFDGKKIYSPADMSEKLETLAGKQIRLDILRGGAEMSLTVVPQRVALTKPLLKITFDGGELALLETADARGTKSVRVFSAKNGGAAAGDILYQIDSVKINSADDVKKAFAKTKKTRELKFAAENFDLSQINAAKTSLEEVPPQTRVMIGYSLKADETIKHIPVGEQFADSLSKVYGAVASLINPQSDIGISSLAGPVDIGRLIYKLSYTAFTAVLSFTVLLNINLAVLNMLPIPVLDGGHILFALAEKLRGKPVSPAVFATIQTAFSLAFLALMAYIVYIGFARWDGDNSRERQSEIYNQYYTKIKF